MDLSVFRGSVGLSAGPYPSDTSREAPHSYQFTRHMARFSRKAPRDLLSDCIALFERRVHAYARGLPLPVPSHGQLTGNGRTVEPQRRCAGKGKEE